MVSKEIEEIKKQAADMTLKFKALLERKKMSGEQDKAVSGAYHGLLFWRRTDLALMIKTFVKSGNETK